MRNSRHHFYTATATTLLLLLGAAPPLGARTSAPRVMKTASLPSLAELLPGMQEKKPETKLKPAKTSLVSLPEGDGRDVTKKACSLCHGTDVFAKQRHTLEKWDQIIDNMVAKGMVAKPDDLDKMGDYLAKYLGPEPAPAAAPAEAPPAKPDSAQPQR